MSDRTAYVYVDLDGRPVLVGTLHARFRKNRESASFAYDRDVTAVERETTRVGRPDPHDSQTVGALAGSVAGATRRVQRRRRD
jgi:hypothetical protein